MRKFTPAPQEGAMHPTHREGPIDMEEVANEIDKGYCDLCDFYTEYPSQMRGHRFSVHAKRAFYILGRTLLFCKCTEAPTHRGHDGSVRTGHYHCSQCWKPVDGKGGLRMHLISKHGYKLPQLQGPPMSTKRTEDEDEDEDEDDDDDDDEDDDDDDEDDDDDDDDEDEKELFIAE